MAIEHRFYGASQPTGDYSDLTLLSVDQGLADFVVLYSFLLSDLHSLQKVIDALKTQYNTTNTVVFGCSYIGSGAAWFRAKYPHVAGVL